MKITVKAKPNSRENKVVQLGENSYEVKVSVPPEKGKANEKVIELIAKELKVPKSKICIIKGASGRDKVLEITK